MRYLLLFSRVQAAINGEVVGEFDSYAGSTFNVLGIEGVGVDTLSLKYVDASDNGWISIIEVSKGGPLFFIARALTTTCGALPIYSKQQCLGNSQTVVNTHRVSQL